MHELFETIISYFKYKTYVTKCIDILGKIEPPIYRKNEH